MDRANADIIVDLAHSYQMCNECGFVDRDMDRARPGYKCQVCGKPSIGEKKFLTENVLILIRHIYKAYYFVDYETGESRITQPDEFKDLAVVIFFCILKEVLLEKFLITYMHAKKLPEGVINRLTTDNDSHTRRLYNLFPTLIGFKWNEVINKLPSKEPKRYYNLNYLLERTAKARNKLLHEAYDGSITPRLADECFDNIHILLDCFKLLNNIYIHPILKAAC